MRDQPPALNAFVGSSDAARLAGTADATTATMASNSATDPRLKASIIGTPTSSDWITRPRMTDPTTPATTPHSVTRTASPTTRPSTFPRSAPNASRTPISNLRSDTA